MCIDFFFYATKQTSFSDGVFALVEPKSTKAQRFNAKKTIIRIGEMKNVKRNFNETQG